MWSCLIWGIYARFRKKMTKCLQLILSLTLPKVFSSLDSATFDLFHWDWKAWVKAPKVVLTFSKVFLHFFWESNTIKSWGSEASISATLSFKRSEKWTLKDQIVLALQTISHYSYLDIYISRKIRLCVVDLEGQFQTSLQTKIMNFLIWKWRSIILIFLLFFPGVVKSTAFYTLLLLFCRVEISALRFDAKTWLKH